ncbi:hypothetical protein Q5752_001189 [Cryptotrichosporon argae]
MPAIQPGSLVLVTGASGFIAAHAAKTFLDAGYPVRGTVRSADKGEYLVDLFKGSKAEFTYAIVEDIEQPDAFDEAVKGVAGVAHMASPFHMNAEDPQDLIGPAVGGTVGILKSLQKFNPDVARVVITSSCASVVDDDKPTPYHYTEEDWNDYSARLCAEKGKDTPASHKYRASKALAERAFWKFFEDEKPKFDGVTINPPMVYGPIIHQVRNPESLNTSVAAFYDWLKGGKTEAEIPDVAASNWVEVRDVALAHVRALTVPEASGQRFITSNGPASPNDLVLAIHRQFPGIKNVPAGDAAKVAAINARSNVFDGSKARKVLGINYIDLDTSVKDMGESVIKRFNLDL